MVSGRGCAQAWQVDLQVGVKASEQASGICANLFMVKPADTLHLSNTGRESLLRVLVDSLMAMPCSGFLNNYSTPWHPDCRSLQFLHGEDTVGQMLNRQFL
jgi:hypothetical protein